MSDLVIVESPAKAKTIKKYLGSGYEVVASMGHVRDLPKSRLSVDIKKNFAPKYEIIKGKEKLVDDLKSAAEKSEHIYLATDPDREGEAISWHLAYILGLPTDETNRVEFNEITKSGVTNGMSNPRSINIDLVNAQQARRILDRLVGYKLSPFISQKIRRGLSAGRVQSVAVRIIVDREEEIRKFKPEEYWSIDAKFIPKGSRKSFSASLYSDENGKIKITNGEQADKIEADLQNAEYVITDRGLFAAKGIFGKKISYKPFTEIYNIEIKKEITDSICNTGTIIVMYEYPQQSGSFRGFINMTPLKIKNIPDYLQVCGMLKEKMRCEHYV